VVCLLSKGRRVLQEVGVSIGAATSVVLLVHVEVVVLFATSGAT
jgi:hypothetical protein